MYRRNQLCQKQNLAKLKTIVTSVVREVLSPPFTRRQVSSRCESFVHIDFKEK
jgi:hypothetical protein